MVGRWCALIPLTLLIAGCEKASPVELPMRPEAPVLRVEAARAQVEIRPEQRSDLVIDSIDPGLTVTQQGASLQIAGEPAGKTTDCTVAGPRLVVRAPSTVQVIATGGVSGQVGPATELRLANNGCGAWRAGAVSGPAYIVQAGGGSVSLDEARALTADTRGDGVVRVTELFGPFAGSLEGGGAINVVRGVSPKANLRLKGSGEIVHSGQVGSLEADLTGSGRIHAALVTGQVAKTVDGSGDVTWARPAGRAYCGGSDCSR